MRRAATGLDILIPGESAGIWPSAGQQFLQPRAFPRDQRCGCRRLLSRLSCVRSRVPTLNPDAGPGPEAAAIAAGVRRRQSVTTEAVNIASHHRPASPNPRVGVGVARAVRHTDVALARELFQRGPIAHRPTMTKGIGKTSLTMGSLWRVVVSCLFHIGRAGLHSALYELIGSGDENLDPSGCEAGLSRAQLLPLTRHSFVEKEWRATELKPGNAAQVPQLSGAKRCLIPPHRSISVGHDQHHREGWLRIRGIHSVESNGIVHDRQSSSSVRLGLPPTPGRS